MERRKTLLKIKKYRVGEAKLKKRIIRLYSNYYEILNSHRVV